MIDVDTTELRRLAADLTAAPAQVQREAGAIVFKGALNVKARMRSDLEASAHFKPAAAAVDFDIRHPVGFGAIEALIGPRSGPGQPGAIANIAYFGSATGGGTVPDPVTALDEERPRFEKALADVLGRIL